MLNNKTKGKPQKIIKNKELASFDYLNKKLYNETIRLVEHKGSWYGVLRSGENERPARAIIRYNAKGYMEYFYQMNNKSKWMRWSFYDPIINSDRHAMRIIRGFRRRPKSKTKEKLDKIGEILIV